MSERPGNSSGGDTHVSPRLFSEPLPKRRVFRRDRDPFLFGSSGSGREALADSVLDESVDTFGRQFEQQSALRKRGENLAIYLQRVGAEPALLTRAGGAAPTIDERLKKRCRERFACRSHVEIWLKSGRFGHRGQARPARPIPGST